MHTGFELFLNSSDFNKDSYNMLIESGRERYNISKIKIEDKLNSFILENGSLDGSRMQDNWFPQINADIFISHSHQDENLAIALSEYLNTRFGLSVFIDSCIWGYSDNLLRIIDNEYCLNPSGETYDYVKRNYSTSHVHMMLSTALTMMIDKAECILFLNTPNSITPNEVILKTKSPWIYSEIAITNLIRKKPIEEYRIKRMTESFSEGGELKKGLDIEYIINTEHLTSIDVDIFREWESTWKFSGKKYAPNYSKHVLDTLYEIISKSKKYEYFEK